MSNPWPERESVHWGQVEDGSDYLIRMVQQLFVEIAQVKAMLEKPLYHITVPVVDGTENLPSQESERT